MADFSKAFHFPSFLPRRGPTTPVSPRRHGFGLFRVRSPLLTESLFIFSSYGYLDVSVPHVRLPFGMTGLQPAGLPHSDIPGSTAICASPGLFAAYHVLRRLREPRHPPCALYYFCPPPRERGRVRTRQRHPGRLILSAFRFSFTFVHHVKDRVPSGNVENNGFEPLTLCVQGRCSSQLS